MTNGDPLEQYPHDASCQHADCTAKLSRYNPSPLCGVHKGWQDTASRSYG